MDAEVVVVTWAAVADAGSLATAAAAELLGEHPGPLHHLCPTCGSIGHGRPSFDAPVRVSFAHTAGLSVVAVSTAGPVGVDVEPAGRASLSWVRAEAIGKAYGVGLTGPAGDALVHDLPIPGYVAALAVLAEERPAIRLAGPGAPASPAMR